MWMDLKEVIWFLWPLDLTHSMLPQVKIVERQTFCHRERKKNIAVAPATNDKNRFWFASSFSGDFQTPRCRAPVCVVPSPDVSVFPVLTICSHNHRFLQIPVCHDNNIYKIRVPCDHGNIIPGLKPFLKAKYIPRTSTFVSVGSSLFSVGGKDNCTHWRASKIYRLDRPSTPVWKDDFVVTMLCPRVGHKVMDMTVNCIPWVVW